MEVFVCLATAAAIAALGAYMLVTGDCRLLHGYHYATTPVAERPLLARGTGACIVLLAVGTAALTPQILPDGAAVVGVALIVLSVVGMLAVIVRHNGGLITFAPGVGAASAGAPSRGAVAAVVGVGVLLSLVGFVPGFYMMATGDVSLLHPYHYANVAAADLPAFAKAEGAAIAGLGAAILLCTAGAAGMYARRPTPLWAKALLGVGCALLAASLVAMLLAIIHYNGSLMGE